MISLLPTCRPAPRPWHRLLGLVFCCGVVPILATGCRNWDPFAGPGFRDEFADDGSKLRPARKVGSGQAMGLSSKSRQIEADLGVE
jgi:hypothetical protein